MKIRSMVRLVFIVGGLIEVYVFVSGGFKRYPDLFMGGMFIFIAATNFCTQCPLFSAVKRMFKRQHHKKIATEKI